MRQTDVFWVPLEKPYPAVNWSAKSEHFYLARVRENVIFQRKYWLKSADPCRIGFGLVLSCRIVHSADGNAEINCAEAGAPVASICAFSVVF